MYSDTCLASSSFCVVLCDGHLFTKAKVEAWAGCAIMRLAALLSVHVAKFAPPVTVPCEWLIGGAILQVLILNRTRLPPEALFLIRHQRFIALNRPGQPYSELLSESDQLMVPWLSRFRELSAYKRSDEAPPGRLTGQSFRNYYSGLMRKYIPSGTLRW